MAEVVWSHLSYKDDIFKERTHAKNGGGFKVLKLMTHAELNIKSIPRHGKC